MTKMMKFVSTLIAALLISLGAQAQGPGPSPSPWKVVGPSVVYDNGSALLPRGVTGGDKGIGTINVSGGYYINGVSITTLPCTSCAVTNATNTFTANQIININGGATPAAQSGMVLQAVAANSATGRIEVDTYAGTTIITGVRANGTLASPTTLANNDEILSLNAWGYDGTSRSGPAAAVRLYAGGAWSNTSHPTYIDLATTAASSTTLTSRFQVANDGGLISTGVTGGSQGSGTINISGNLFKNGAAPQITINTTPCPLYGSCTITSSSGSITIGTTVVNGGAGVLYNASSGGFLAAATTGNNQVFVTDGSGTPSFSSTLAITATNANALAVGQAGTTNPSLKVDTSTASSATGWSIKSAAAAGGVALSVISSGTNENGTIDAKGSGTLTLNGTATGNVVVARALVENVSIAIAGCSLGGAVLCTAGANGLGGATTITSNSATSLVVGPNGTTNPVLTVDSSVGSQATGIKLTGAATGGTTALVVTDSGTNANLSVNAKGSGTISIAGTSTGATTIGGGGGGVTLSSALTYGGVTLNNAVTGTGNMVLSASPTLSGTVAGSITLSGTNTYSGNSTFSAQAIHTGTSAPASAAGNTVIMGALAAAPTLSNNGQAFFYNMTVNGAVMQGAGSTNDNCILNKNGSTVMCNPTGTQNAVFSGSVTIPVINNGINNAFSQAYLGGI